MPSEVTYREFGGPDVLTWASGAELPEPLPSQVVVAVAAASVTTLDARIRRGELERFITTHFPAGVGREAAGVVIARGTLVRDIQIGEAVLGIADTAGYAQFAALSMFVRKPHNLGWAVAASLPVATEAAFRALRLLDPVSGSTLLIAGGGGNIGSLAAQLAVARGVHVIVTARASDEKYLRTLGVRTVRYGDGFASRVRSETRGGIDAVFDTAGVGLLPELISLAGSPDKVLSIADLRATIHGVHVSEPVYDAQFVQDLADVAASVAAGELSVRIGHTYPFERVAQAHRDLESRRWRGRLALVG